MKGLLLLLIPEFLSVIHTISVDHSTKNVEIIEKTSGLYK